MNIFKNMIEMGNRIKPILIKIIPIGLLRAIKKSMVSYTMKKLKSTEILPFQPDKYKQGINLIGSIKAATGLGQSCRLIESVLAHSDIEYVIYNYAQSTVLSIEDNSYDSKISKELPYGINLFHVNAHEFPIACTELDKDIWSHRYNIAFWLWELEEFPDEWTESMDLLDEIWTPAEFVSESIRKKTNLPVRTIPYFVTAPIEEKYDRKYFQLPEDMFLFLTMYDSNSVKERKNPEGALKAFRDAFDKNNQKVGIVIKINNPQKKDLEIIDEILGGYKNVYLIRENLEKVQVNSLIKSVDAFISLHRAEGFGLVLAEAMIHGIPTIATNWSANTEFMNSQVACMVDYELVELKEDIRPYKKGNRWAEADINQAADFMKKLYEDNNFYQEISKSSKEYIRDKLSEEQAVTLIRDRIEKIYESKK